MMNKVIAIIVIILIVLGGLFLFKNKGVAPTDTEVEDNTPSATSTEQETTPTPTTGQTPTPTPTPTPEPPVVKEFAIDNDHFSFTPSSLTVNKGDTVKITFRNTGGTHNLKIDEFSGASTRNLSPGESQTITFVALKSGSFQYYCSVGNHRAQGMWGTLNVL